MNCNEFEQQLDTEIGKRPLDTIAKLSEHATQCDRCVELWNGYLQLEEMLPLWNSNLPEIDIIDSVIAKRNDDLASTIPQPQVTLSHVALSKQSRTESSGRSLTLVIVTAVMMLAIGLLMFQPSNRTDIVKNPSHIPVVVDITPETTTDDNASPEIRSLVKDAGFAYYSLAQNAVDVFADASMLLPDSEEMQMPDLLHDEEMPQPLDNIIESIEKDVKPIQSDLRKAIDFLFISVPNHTS